MRAAAQETEPPNSRSCSGMQPGVDVDGMVCQGDQESHDLSHREGSDAHSGDDEDETQLLARANEVHRDVENGDGFDEVGPVDAEPSYVVGSDDDADDPRDEQQHDRNVVWRAGGRQAALTPEHQAVTERGDAD